MEDISKHVTLFQLMDSLGNLNHAISVFGNWIFESNYEKALVLNRASLDMICAPSFGEEQADKFESIFTAVRYIYSTAQLKKGYLWCISQSKIISNSVAIRNIEGNDIDLLTISYSKETNLCWIRRK